MSTIRAFCISVLFCVIALNARAQGSLLPLPDEKPIVGMNFPALSPDGKTICFTYLGDLWTVPSTGGVATRLTIHEAFDGSPRWSPDGQWIAFTSSREGTYDIFVIPSVGGPARQLTYHSANDWCMDWSPDGSKILFYSTRGAQTWQLFSIDVKTGVVKTLTHDNLNLRYACYAPDGSAIAYSRSANVGVWWRPRYHGSANIDIFTKSLKDGKITRVTDYDGQDLWPMYAPNGKTLYYVTDRLTPGTPNLVSAPVTGGKPTLLTKHSGDAVRWPNMARNGSLIAYIYNGGIWTVSPTGGQPTRLAIYARSDDKQNNIVRLTLTDSATEVEVSPDGKTLALVVRGEIWTIPTGGGEAKRLTNNPARDYDIIWSPDSSKLLFSSDRKGNFDIYTVDVKTKEEKQLTDDPNDEEDARYSPDGKLISFLRNGAQGGLYVMNADGSGTARRLAESFGLNLFGYGIQDSYSWSPDSKWLAFSRRDPASGVSVRVLDIWVVPVAGGNAVNVTHYPAVNDQPEWSVDGKYLLFLSSRDRDQGMDIYSLPLEKERAEPEPASSSRSSEVRIDFDDIENRARRLTTQGTGPFKITPDGRLVIFLGATFSGPEYFSVPVNGGSVQRLTGAGDGTDIPRFGSDPSRFYALGANGTIKVIQRSGPVWQASSISFSARMEIDLRAERAQAFNEFWRRLNVGFYDPKMHGVDWKAVRARYEPLLSGIATKDEFALFLLPAMVGELNASHSEVSPAPGPPIPETAELGMTFDEDYPGPGLKVTGYLPKGPDDDLGPKIKPGEYILQIDGEDVVWNETLAKRLADRAGKTVELLVHDKPDKNGARTVKIKPITRGQWFNLVYEQRVKTAREMVDRLSGGRLAYIHVRAMDQGSLRLLERELWGKAREKEGLVLDIRDNGGGNTHDDILAQLTRVPYAYSLPRDGVRATEPGRYWHKPIVLLIDEGSVSDAEIFPLGFRALKLGKIVGEPTPGYVISVSGQEQRLQDGTTYRVPFLGWYSLDGKTLENNGVRPDILVEHTLEDIATGRDRQLEVAVQTLLKELPRK